MPRSSSGRGGAGGGRRLAPRGSAQGLEQPGAAPRRLAAPPAHPAHTWLGPRGAGRGAESRRGSGGRPARGRGAGGEGTPPGRPRLPARASAPTARRSELRGQPTGPSVAAPRPAPRGGRARLRAARGDSGRTPPGASPAGRAARAPPPLRPGSSHWEESRPGPRAAAGASPPPWRRVPDTHDDRDGGSVADSLLSVLAIRAQEIAEDIFAHRGAEEAAKRVTETGLAVAGS